MEAMKPCPFCGGTKLKVDTKQKLDGYCEIGGRVNAVTASVRCSICHARGSTAGGKTIDAYRYTRREQELPKWATTLDDLKRRAIDLWNYRVGEGG